MAFWGRECCVETCPETWARVRAVEAERDALKRQLEVLETKYYDLVIAATPQSPPGGGPPPLPPPARSPPQTGRPPLPEPAWSPPAGRPPLPPSSSSEPSRTTPEPFYERRPICIAGETPLLRKVSDSAPRGSASSKSPAARKTLALDVQVVRSKEEGGGGGGEVTAAELREALADGDVIFLRFDGARYHADFKATRWAVEPPEPTTPTPTTPRTPVHAKQRGRLLDEFGAAIQGLDLYSAPAAFEACVRDFASVAQRRRYADILTILDGEKRAAIAVFRIVKAPREYAEPPREGDAVVVWTPDIENDHRALRERTAVAVPVVQSLFEALEKAHVLAPFTHRLDASHAVVDEADDDDNLAYDFLYKTLFQVARISQGNLNVQARGASPRTAVPIHRRHSWRNQPQSWRSAPPSPEE